MLNVEFLYPAKSVKRGCARNQGCAQFVVATAPPLAYSLPMGTTAHARFSATTAGAVIRERIK